jgi:putative membrane protein
MAVPAGILELSTTMSKPAGQEEVARHNDPNRTRDHLANERTYLSWIRTAVALLGFGVVIVRLRYLLPPGTATHGHGWQLGLLMALLGVLMVPLATSHYFHVRRAIEVDSYQPSGRWIIACSFVITLIGAGVILYLYNSPGLPAGFVPHAAIP